MDFSTELAEWRSKANRDAALYAVKYPQGNYGTAFPSIARRWADALNRSELDPNEMRAVISDAERYEFDSGISFYTYIVDMRKIYRRVWEHFLKTNRGDADGHSRTE